MRQGRSLLITAAALAAALILPLQASAAPPGCGDTITANTTLSADLVGCSSGLSVVGPATLDLGGHTIAGIGAGTGVLLSPGASVVNGTVRGFATGVFIDRVAGFTSSGSSELIQNLTVTGNETGIGTFRFGGYQIRNNTVSANGTGIVTSATGGDISFNRILLNAGDGVEAGFADLVTYRGNVVLQNGGRGIDISTGTSELIGNVASHNGSDGIFVSEGTGLFFHYLFKDNVADDNGGWGIAFFGIPIGGDPPQNVDGGGNAAKHNANPEQCHIIVCARNRGLAQ
jgi:Right handed beta helix region